MSVPGEQPYGQVQPYRMPPGGNPPMPYGATAYPSPGNHNAAAIAILGRKSGGLAAVLSILLVGAGQMYCGRVGRGLAFLGAYIVSYLLMLVLIGFILAPIVFIWALVDAVNLAGRHNAELAHRLSLGSPGYY